MDLADLEDLNNDSFVMEEPEAVSKPSEDPLSIIDFLHKEASPDKVSGQSLPANILGDLDQIADLKHTMPPLSFPDELSASATKPIDAEIADDGADKESGWDEDELDLDLDLDLDDNPPADK